MGHEQSTKYTLTRGEEDYELDVVYNMTTPIPASWLDPAEGGEIEIKTIYFGIVQFQLTHEEEAKLEEWLYENEEYEYDDD